MFDCPFGIDVFGVGIFRSIVEDVVCCYRLDVNIFLEGWFAVWQMQEVANLVDGPIVVMIREGDHVGTFFFGSIEA